MRPKARTYQQLPIWQFGEHLLATKDLDPIYVAIYKSEWETPEHLHRWLVAYWCFYHVGLASYLSEQRDNFWQVFLNAVVNDLPAPDGGRWPRGSERRHFRGIQAKKSFDYLHTHTPTELVRYFMGNQEEPESYSSVATRVQNVVGFGKWISFKVADMLERIYGKPIQFASSELMMFDEPYKAAVKLYDLDPKVNRGFLDVPEQDKVRYSVAALQSYFADHDAPPSETAFETSAGRKVGLQEIETILCKWKSHVNGHYPLLKDTIEFRETLIKWAPLSKTAAELLINLPRAGQVIPFTTPLL